MLWVSLENTCVNSVVSFVAAVPAGLYLRGGRVTVYTVWRALLLRIRKLQCLSSESPHPGRVLHSGL